MPKLKLEICISAGDERFDYFDVYYFNIYVDNTNVYSKNINAQWKWLSDKPVGVNARKAYYAIRKAGVEIAKREFNDFMGRVGGAIAMLQRMRRRGEISDGERHCIEFEVSR